MIAIRWQCLCAQGILAHHAGTLEEVNLLQHIAAHDLCIRWGRRQQLLRCIEDALPRHISQHDVDCAIRTSSKGSSGVSGNSAWKKSMAKSCLQCCAGDTLRAVVRTFSSVCLANIFGASSKNLLTYGAELHGLMMADRATSRNGMHRPSSCCWER